MADCLTTIITTTTTTTSTHPAATAAATSTVHHTQNDLREATGSQEEDEEEEEEDEEEVQRLREGGVDFRVLMGRRITLKPKRTLSLSPTPARTGDMSMGRNLIAARCLDFTDKDDDDGLHQHHEDDKDKGDEEENQVSIKPRNVPRRPAPSNLISSSSSSTVRKASVSVKRPLELPCQEIRYLEIPYQKVGTLSISMPQMDFSPIPWKKINYHPVLHHTIHYVDVQYCGERPNKRKPLGRSRSFAAVADLKEKVDSEWIYKFR